MKLVDQYIASSVAYAILLVLIILTGLQLFILLIAQLGDLGAGQYNLWQAFQTILLTMPSAIYTFFPLAAVVGSLLGLGYLATHQELTVMRASGFSIAQIIRAVLYGAMILLLVMTMLGEWLGPYALHLAKIHKAELKNAGQAYSTLQGVWVRADQSFIHIGSVSPDLTLFNVTQYTFDQNHHLLRVLYAPTGQYRQGEWWLNRTQETDINQLSTTTKMNANTVLWPVKLKPEVLSMSSDDPQDISLVDLVRLIHYRQMNGLQINSYQLVFWQRLFQPFSTLIMIMLAVPFIFGSLRSVPMGLRIIVGVVMGFSFYLLNRFFGPFSLVYDIPPILAAGIPSLLFLLLGGYFFYRGRRT